MHGKKNNKGTCLEGIMSHTSFSHCVIDRPSEGVMILVPKEQIIQTGPRSGQIKKRVATRIDELTKENILELEKAQVIVQVTANQQDSDGGMSA